MCLTDRASGFCIIWKIRTLHSLAVVHIIAIALRGLPVRTITCDNGIEFARHKTIERLLECQIYCTGSCPWWWCSCDGVITAISGGAGLFRLP